MFQNIAKVIEIRRIVSKHCWGDRNTSHRFKTLLAMFWINMTCFYYLSNVLKQCDVFLSLWSYCETMWLVSITLAIFWNNAMCFHHFGDLLKLSDTFLSLWRSFETMRRVSITLAIFWNSATRFYHFGDLFEKYNNRFNFDYNWFKLIITRHPSVRYTSHCFKRSLKW